MKKSLLECMEKKLKGDVVVRRYDLSTMISESYKACYDSPEGSNLRKLAESHLSDVKNNPTDIDRLSRQLCVLKKVVRMTESGQLKDEDLVNKKSYDTVAPKKDRVIVKKEECNESLLDETDDVELTDEEVEDLAKHLDSIRKERKEAKTTPKTDMTEKCEPRKLKKRTAEATKPRKLKKRVEESNSYQGLQNFKKQSKGKAFMKTFKKLDKKLHEGTTLTRQESIDLYKAANSAMTQLTIELEKNPKFLQSFRESTAILSNDVNSLLESMQRGKAPSKSTMKSLAKFSESLLCEDKVYYPNGKEVAEDSVDMDKALDYQYGEDRDKDNSKYSVEEKQKAINYWIEKTDPMYESEEIEIPEDDDFVGDDEGDVASEEVDAFDQAYADARADLHKELVDTHSDSEDPEVLKKLEKDAEEVLNLPGLSDEKAAELSGETEEDGGEPESPEAEDDPVDSDEDITDDELEELKKHLTEIRKAKKLKESQEATIGDTIKVVNDLDYYTSHGYKENKKGYVVKKSENYGVFIDEYRYLIPHSDYEIVK